MIEPLGYLEFLNLMANARLVLTDSGGIMEKMACYLDRFQPGRRCCNE